MKHLLPDYTAHARHLRSAAPGGTMLAVIGALIGLEVAFILMPSFVALMAPGGLPDGYATGSTPWGMIVGLLGFAVPASVLFVIVRRVFGYSAFGLLGDARLALTDGVAVARILVMVLLAVFAIDILAASSFAPHARPFGSWLMFGLLALPAIFVQTSTEELVYRGFLQQQLGLRSQSPLVWMGIPSLLFGLSHIGYSTDLTENIHYVGWSFCFGLVMADLTARTGSLGPALAMHFVYNSFGFLFIGWLNGPNSGLALFLYDLGLLGDGINTMEVDFVPDDIGTVALIAVLFVQYLPLFVMWLAARVAVRR